METATDKALQELHAFLEAEDIYGGDDFGGAVKAFIEAYTENTHDFALAQDACDTAGEKIEKLEGELDDLIGQTDAARSLWNLILNLCSEFDAPATVRPDVDHIDLSGCERIIQKMAKIVRGAIKAGHGRLR